MVPRAWAERLADAAGDWAHRGAPEARRTVVHNLTAVLGSTPASATVRGVFRTYARYYLGMMRLRHRTARAAIGPITWEHSAALEASVGRGRGVLVLSAHLGHWDVLGVELARRFGAMTVFVEALQPESVARFYTLARTRHGVRIAPVGAPGRAPVETLRRGGILGLTADRAFGKHRARVRCGTASIEIPLGGIQLALRTGAAIHAAFAIRTPAGLRLVCGEDLSAGLTTTGASPDDAIAVARRFAAILADTVQRSPEQWCVLQRVAHAVRVRGAA